LLYQPFLAKIDKKDGYRASVSAHFGLPFVYEPAPGTIAFAVNVTWMETLRKRIQCLPNASQHVGLYPSIFNVSQ